MKPLHVGLLVIAGAMGGALVMKTATHSAAPPSAPAPQVAAKQPAPVAEPAPPVEAVEPEKAPATPRVDYTPAPVIVKHPKPAAMPKPVAAPKPAKAVKPERVYTAHNTVPPPPPQPHATPVTTPATQPAAPAPPPPPVEEPAPAPATPEPVRVEPPSPPPLPPARQVTLPAGFTINARMIDGLDTSRNQQGDEFTATLDAPLVVDGLVIAERGARLRGRVTEAERAGKMRKGYSALSLELTRVHTSDNQDVHIQTEAYRKIAQRENLKDAEKVGAGAAIGAIIGAIAGGGKGAAIGAGVGGAAGVGGVMATRGDDVHIPSETRITFRLRAPVTVTERR